MKLLSRAATIAPISTNAAYADEEARLAKWREERSVMEDELLVLETQLHRMMTGEEIEDIAAAMFSGGDVSSETQASLLAKMGELRTRIAAYRKADALQLQRIRDVRAELSVAAAEALLPAYRKAVAKVLAAIDTLDSAVAEALKIHTALPEAGYDQRFPNLMPPAVRPGASRHAEPWAVRAYAFAEGKGL